MRKENLRKGLGSEAGTLHLLHLLHYCYKDASHYLQFLHCSHSPSGQTSIRPFYYYISLAGTAFEIVPKKSFENFLKIFDYQLFVSEQFCKIIFGAAAKPDAEARFCGSGQDIGRAHQPNIQIFSK